ncbi:cytochrome c biogenesis protein ResB [Phocicoccus pinnipedialis]|uniref:Cytochrome c biogenesis protein CcsB n=1 Tax=Phocicoccus pinnipedialis TaxID=110845 RepID=A0A6V7REC5_9BACL|nr:cytochrome c biogenesis protein ResB [Jeotgalicoccus pinnipedialis]MBP1939349.1 cytochrome c biogenesis protein [Jeotgalicoccus pinnipedialis]CAD2075749.1 Cytochrome c biogenesis protein CcsB [Jeotgalicoccus pinnipedialis]
MELKEIKCPHCGHVNSPGTQLCQSCGLMINEDYDKKKIKDVMRYDGSAVRSKVKSQSIFDKIWIFFTSIRNGVIIIALIALAAAIGTILPQQYFIPIGVDPEVYYADNYGTFGYLYYKLGFHNLYSSWWFVLLNAMLALSIIAASVDRGVPLYKSLKNQRAKKHPSFFRRQRLTLNSDEITKENIDKIVEGLKSKRYKVTEDGPHLLFEKGRLSRWGPYINHTGLIIVLIGSMLRFFPGMYIDEIVYVPEGETVEIPTTDNKYYVKNEKFILDTYDKGSGSVFDKSLAMQGDLASNYQTNIIFYENLSSDVVGSEPDLKEIDKDEIRVNHPYKFDNYELYQSSFDNSSMKSMTFKLVDSNDKQIGEEFTVDLKDPDSDYSIDDKTDIQLRAFAPDFLEIGKKGELLSQSPVPRNPAFIFQVNNETLETPEISLLQIQNTDEITPNNEFKVKFVSMENEIATVLTLKKDLTMHMIGIGFIIFLLGVFIGSYINHRRIWINKEKGLSIAAHTNKNYYGLKKELNSVLNEHGVDSVNDKDEVEHNDRMKG